jgi:hypothetical protein
MPHSALATKLFSSLMKVYRTFRPVAPLKAGRAWHKRLFWIFSDLKERILVTQIYDLFPLA